MSYRIGEIVFVLNKGQIYKAYIISFCFDKNIYCCTSEFKPVFFKNGDEVFGSLEEAKNRLDNFLNDDIFQELFIERKKKI